MNFWQGVGEGYIEADWYAPERYTSQIEGIKNIRFGRDRDEILVKVISPKGLLLPNKVVIGDEIINITFEKSDKYNWELNY